MLRKRTGANFWLGGPSFGPIRQGASEGSHCADHGRQDELRNGFAASGPKNALPWNIMDQPPSDQSSGDLPNDADSGIIPEEELADVFSQASGLADELAKQLDEEGSATPSGEPLGSLDSLAEPPELDEQLENLDHLIKAASNELVETPTEPGSPQLERTEPSDLREPSQQDGPSNADASDDSPVPEFMDEFTVPEGPKALRAESAIESDLDATIGFAQSTTPNDAPPTPAVQAGPKPGIVRTGVVGASVSNGGETQQGSTDQLPSAPGSERKARRWPLETMKKIAASATDRLAVGLLPVADKLVGLLEKSDRPFTFLSARIRRVVGWVAIATIGTSIVVLIWTSA